MIVGYGRHGKDTACEYLRDRYGFTFESSSHFVAEKAVRPWLSVRGVTYETFDEMYADRVNRRSQWFDAISEYNANDEGKLGRELFAEYDIYCGNRRVEEFNKLKGVYDFSIWIDASKRHPPEDRSSITIAPADTDFIVSNNTSVADLHRRLDGLMGGLLEGY
jgi:hypothetical protein